MANEEHLALFRQGVTEWNAWRSAAPGIVPDLRKADLSNNDFRGYNLNRADLSGANLDHTNLLCDLQEAKLCGVHGHVVSLVLCNLWHADLKDAHLSGAYLAGTNFTGAVLAGAHLHEAELDDTIFADTDLSETNGLDTCIHLGPTIIDRRTLLRSGQLPLTGCGNRDKAWPCSVVAG